jgi:DNA repair exonuclease SbcCD ATPase subunit
MSILFKTVRYKNILSTGNAWTEIQLNKDKSTLIIGENGAGKSTMLDALTFALYGKAFRKINKAQLVNSINKKDLQVETEFSISGKEYKIRRCIKPTVFEIWCDGVLLNQDAAARDYQAYLEENILKLNYKSFGQVVVLGSSTFVPFMQLKAAERRSVIEDLLDIQIFTTMNTLLKERVSENKTTIQDLKYKLDLLSNKIESAESHNNSIRNLRKEEVKKILEKIETHESKVVEWDEKADSLLVDVEEQQKLIADNDAVTKRYHSLKNVEGSLQNRLGAIDKELTFYESHDNCPTCKQGIDEDFKTTTIKSRMEKKTAVEDGQKKLVDEIETILARTEEISQIQQRITNLNLDISECRANVRLNETSKKELVAELRVAKEQAAAIDGEHIRELQSELSERHTEQQEAHDEKEMLSVVSAMLKDGGIKTRIIKQYVPVMNKLINKYLAAMDFFVQFELDENFNETIRSRFRDEFSYSSFSEGEKLRIDLALLFTWRAVSKLRNSVSTNLLIMDEIMDSSLDTSGTEEFLKIINEITVDSNIFIISHKGDQMYDKFDNTIKLQKVKNFSQIAT